MRQYTFESLSPYDFELLARDLLSAALNVPLETFAAGRDAGIDLRFLGAPRPAPALVVQCKHYRGSSYSALLRSLRKERPKVEKLRPREYRVVTSQALTPAQKAEIRGVFGQYMKSDDWVYDAGALNVLLSQHPDVERENFKLWLTSAEVLQTVLHNEIFVRTAGFEQRLEQKLRVYVQNKSFFEARALLDKHKVCIIAGAPGIGKTILADVLVVSYLDDGYQPVVVSDDIDEALAVYGADRKQVFYYDDFLGRTASLEKLRKNEDARLIDFIDQIGSARDKRLILTTREYILAQARQRYERLSRSQLDIMKCVIALEDYSKLDRAKILYNHLYFSQLSPRHQREIVLDNRYVAVIEHPNYNPRIIETVVNLSQRSEHEPDQFIHFMFDALARPEQIWRHAFENQLDAPARLLLVLLAGMPPAVLLPHLSTAFRVLHMQQFGEKPAPAVFRSTLRTLEDSFIRIDRYGADRVVAFHNPSVRDFLLAYLDDDHELFRDVVRAAQFFDQTVLLAGYAGLLTHGRDEETRFSGMALAASVAPQLLFDAFERTLRSHQCGVATTRYPHMLLFGDVAPLPIEQRLRLVLEAYMQVPDAKIAAWYERELNAAASAWTAGTGHKDEAVELLRELRVARERSAAGITGLAEVEAAARDWFTLSLESSDDFRALAELSSARDDLALEAAVEAAKEEVVQVLSSEAYDVIASASDADELERSIGLLVETAEYYGIGESEIIFWPDYQERIDELTPPEFDDDDRPFSRVSEPAVSDDREIHSLFDTLVEPTGDDV